MKIFGIGLPKTGTTSLTIALEMLGYTSRHSPMECFTLHHGELSVNQKKIDKYDALTDLPIPHFYPELDICFPNSKFILTHFYDFLLNPLSASIHGCFHSVRFTE